MTVRLLTPAGERGLVAVDKPAGLTVLPGSGERAGPCVHHILEQQLGRPVWVVHRLDRDTSGVLLFALDLKSARAASMAFEAGRVAKRYLALVEGRVEAPMDIELPLVEARQRRMRLALPGEEGKPSRTLVRPLRVFAHATLVECEPLTGRQHQIRVHLAAKGHPLLVDHQYGRQPPWEAFPGGPRLERTPLHAASLKMSEPAFAAQSPLPADLRACVEALATSGT